MENPPQKVDFLNEVNFIDLRSLPLFMMMVAMMMTTTVTIDDYSTKILAQHFIISNSWSTTMHLDSQLIKHIYSTLSQTASKYISSTLSSYKSRHCTMLMLRSLHNNRFLHFAIFNCHKGHFRCFSEMLP